MEQFPHIEPHDGDTITDLNGEPLMLDGVPVTHDPSVIVGESGGIFGEVPPIVLETPEESQAMDEAQARKKALATYHRVMSAARRAGYRG